MFAAACATAREFTRPVITSFRHESGECGSGIGAFIIINQEGWIVTANHILTGIGTLVDSNENYKNILKFRQDTINDISIKNGEKQRILNTNKVTKELITHIHTWWGGAGGELVDVKFLPEVDLAIGRLTDFDGAQMKVYPQFKDSSKTMDQGTSLCKMGFPFHPITPGFDTATNSFILPAGAVPAPFFPLEGIFTRVIPMPSAAPPPYPLMYLETSSPGLRGQSGGPTFDLHGAVWAIQSATQHMPLGFGEDQPGNSKKNEHLKNQYLHVGLGIHSQTIIGFLGQHNISFQLSPH